MAGVSDSLSDGAALFQTHRLTMSDGVPLTAYSCGDPGKPAVILVNAYGMPVQFMVPLAQALREHVRVLTWDSRVLPGIDGVDAHAACDVERNVADLREIAALLGVDGALAVAGWCTGASIALEFAATSDRVKSLVLMNGAFYLGKRRKSGFERTMDMVMPLVAEDASYAAMLVSSMQAFYAGRGSTPSDGLRAPSALVVGALDPELAALTSIPYRSAEHLQRYARQLEAFLAYRPSPIALKAACSALIVTGMQDSTIHPSSSLLLHEHSPGSQLLVDAAGDHYLLIKNHALISQVGDHLVRTLCPSTI